MADKRVYAGWTAVGISTLIACFWAYWGSNEAFHEGWYFHAFWKNVGLTFAQYLSPLMIFLLLAVASIRFPRVGGTLHILLGFAIPLFVVRTSAAMYFIAAPLVALGILYWAGRPGSLRAAYACVTGVPLLVALAFGTPAAIRVAQRVDDGNLGARVIEGNGITLEWAPRGPGWPDDVRGYTWREADSICALLTDDGKSVASTPQNIWRLPSADEAVRCMVRHGRNAGGTWDSTRARAAYSLEPDKESPLWDCYSPVIYWWTSTPADDQRAYKVVYNGQVWPARRTTRASYFAFRAVRDPR
ncbi:MAG TPA: DUF1566 domain-containing protein [Bacteroidota bacterium]|nr:DUF1566 domain-containing protein [Bacteroidota bacterium]